jgi:hypothetical protein
VSVLLPTAWLLVTYGFNYASDRWKHVPPRRIDADAVSDSGDEERQQQMLSQRRDRFVAPVVLLLYGVVMTYFAVLGMFYSPTVTGTLTAFVTCAALYLAGGGIAQKVRSARDEKGELLTSRSWGERLRNVPVALFAIPPLQIATWALAQSLFSLPLLVYTVGTRVLGAVFTWRGRSEKCLRPDRAHRSVDMRPKRLLSVIAALPITLARRALPVDSRLQLLLDTVEAQLRSGGCSGGRWKRA